MNDAKFSYKALRKTFESLRDMESDAAVLRAEEARDAVYKLFQYAVEHFNGKYLLTQEDISSMFPGYTIGDCTAEIARNACISLNNCARDCNVEDIVLGSYMTDDNELLNSCAQAVGDIFTHRL